MMYENDADRGNEQRIVRQVERVWFCDAVKVPRPPEVRHFLDYELRRAGQTVAHAEIKHRNYRAVVRNGAITKMVSRGGVAVREYMIDYAKVKAAQELLRPSFLIIEFIDSVWWIRLADPDRIGKGGRKDRNDPNDMDEVAYYKLGRFLPL
jgi:thiamine biosynthesis protein ThiC